MKFENYKTRLERSFIVYADTECTSVKTDDINDIQRRQVNSCCYFFVCTFDSSRNKLRTFVGDNGIIDMLNELKLLADECINEMKENVRMH
jgi:hypothetical protein